MAVVCCDRGVAIACPVAATAPLGTRTSSSRVNARSDAATTLLPSRVSSNRARASRSREQESQPQAQPLVHQTRSDNPNMTISDLNSIITALGVAKQPNYHNNVVPTFDPSLPGHRIDLWLTKVNQCGSIYGWNESQIVHFALQKLAGNAKVWYDSLPSMLFTWKEWQEKILMAFPCEQNCEQKVDQQDKEKLIDLLNKYRCCFALNIKELGCVKDTEMNIDLNDNRPVVYRPYRLAESERLVVRDMVNDLINADVVQKSVSQYAGPVLLVKKKNGNYRLCVDFRALNNKTIKEHYPMPIIEEQISRLASKKFFTALDLASGYYQIPMSLDSRHLTAFVTPDGQYEFKRMPFGLANAPAVFQRMINRVLDPARFSEALTYIDDVLIPSSTVDEGLEKLQNVLEIFKHAGSTLNLDT